MIGIWYWTFKHTTPGNGMTHLGKIFELPGGTLLPLITIDG